MYFNTLSASFFVKEDGSCLCKVGPNFSRRTTHQLCLQKNSRSVTVVIQPAVVVLPGLEPGFKV